MSQQSESNTRMSRTKMQLIFLCKFTSNLLAEAITLTMCRCPNLAAALLNRVNLRRLRGSLFKDPWIKFSPILRTIDSLCMELFGQRSNWLAHSTKARSFYDLCLKWSLEKPFNWFQVKYWSRKLGCTLFWSWIPWQVLLQAGAPEAWSR